MRTQKVITLVYLVSVRGIALCLIFFFIFFLCKEALDNSYYISVVNKQGSIAEPNLSSERVAKEITYFVVDILSNNSEVNSKKIPFKYQNDEQIQVSVEGVNIYTLTTTILKLFGRNKEIKIYIELLADSSLRSRVVMPNSATFIDYETSKVNVSDKIYLMTYKVALDIVSKISPLSKLYFYYNTQDYIDFVSKADWMLLNDLSLTHQQKLQINFLIGDCYLQQQKYKEAFKQYKLIENNYSRQIENKNWAIVYGGKAYALLQQFDTCNALIAMKKGLSKYYNDVYLHNLFAQTYERQGLFQHALKHYEYAHTLDSTNYWLHFNLGNLYLELGCYQHAEKYLQISERGYLRNSDEKDKNALFFVPNMFYKGDSSFYYLIQKIEKEYPKYCYLNYYKAVWISKQMQGDTVIQLLNLDQNVGVYAKLFLIEQYINSGYYLKGQTTLEELSNMYGASPITNELWYSLYLSSGNYKEATNFASYHWIYHSKSSVRMAFVSFLNKEFSKCEYYLYWGMITNRWDTSILDLIANRRMEDGLYNEAIFYLNRHLLVNEQSEVTRYGLALCYQNLRRYAEARIIMEELIKDYPANPEYYFRKGKLMDAEKNPQAIKFYKKAIEIAPFNLEYLESAGDFYIDTWSQSQFILAKPYYQRICSITKSHPESWHGLAIIASSYEGDQEKALEYIYKAVQLDRNNCIYINTLSDILNRLPLEYPTLESHRRNLEQLIVISGCQVN